MIGDHLVEASGKLVVLDKMLSYLKSAGHKVLLFSQMTHMLDVLQDYLGYRGRYVICFLFGMDYCSHVHLIVYIYRYIYMQSLNYSLSTPDSQTCVNRTF